MDVFNVPSHSIHFTFIILKLRLTTFITANDGDDPAYIHCSYSLFYCFFCESLLPVLVLNLCFYFLVFTPAVVLPFYSINYVCIIQLKPKHQGRNVLGAN